jgi:hypothetical protein
MADIFLSYRRADSVAQANGIYERLQLAFGADAVFLDVNSIEAGADFPERLASQVRGSRVVLVLIGNSWLAGEPGARRLDQAGDWVRREILLAYQHVHHVIPVLVAGAAMPGAAELPVDLSFLASRNAVHIRDLNLRDDCEALVRKIIKLTGLRRRDVASGWRKVLGLYVPTGVVGLLLRVVSILAALSLFVVVASGNLGVYPAQVFFFFAVLLVTRSLEIYLG